MKCAFIVASSHVAGVCVCVTLGLYCRGEKHNCESGVSSHFKGSFHSNYRTFLFRFFIFEVKFRLWKRLQQRFFWRWTHTDEPNFVFHLTCFFCFPVPPCSCSDCISGIIWHTKTLSYYSNVTTRFLSCKMNQLNKIIKFKNSFSSLQHWWFFEWGFLEVLSGQKKLFKVVTLWKLWKISQTELREYWKVSLNAL